MDLTPIKRFHAAAKDSAGFYNSVGEPRLNIEGIVELSSSSAITSSTTLIGKPSTGINGDFDVTFGTPTTITFSNYPAGITGFTTADIESVKQINAAGEVVHVYTRDNSSMTVTGDTLTVPGAVFTGTDSFIVTTNAPRTSVSGGASGAGGGAIVYTNAAGDFIATVTNGAKTITITGLPFTLEALHVVGGAIKKIAVTTNIVTTVPLTNVSVSGGVITLPDTDNFVTGDVVMVTLIGPDKAYDTALDTQLVTVQNPDYAHTTSVETLVSESAWPGVTAYTDDGAGNATTITDATAAFTLATINDVVGYKVWSITDGTYGNVAAYSSATTITTTGGDVVSWASDAFKIPVAKRYEINMDTYNFLTIHYRLSADLHTCYTMKIYGTLDASATVDADTNWVDLSTAILGAASITADGITAAGTVVSEGIKILSTPSTMLKYMIKIVAEGDAAAATGSSATIFTKKSS